MRQVLKVCHVVRQVIGNGWYETGLDPVRPPHPPHPPDLPDLSPLVVDTERSQNQGLDTEFRHNTGAARGAHLVPSRLIA